MTTRKHKPATPPAPAAKKRPPAQASKPAKTAAAEKSAAVGSVARDKERPKPAAAPKKSAGETPHVKPVATERPAGESPVREIKAAEAPRPPELKNAAPPAVEKSAGAKPATAVAAPAASHVEKVTVVEKTVEKIAVVEKKPTLGIERRVPVMPEDRQSQLKLLIARGKEQGYLTYSQVNDHLPSEIVDPEQIEDIVNTINDMGIPVYEKAPDTESLLQNEPSAPADEEAIEERSEEHTSELQSQ